MKTHEKELLAQKKQQARNAKKRLSHVKEQILLQFHSDYQTVRNELQLKTCRRLVNLLYLHAISPDSFGITSLGLDCLHDYNIKLRSE